MTEATAIRDRISSHTTPKIYYQVAMPQPKTHVFEVTLQVEGWQEPWLDLHMAVWTPGSYLVREYAKQVQDLQAQVKGKEVVLSSCKKSKNHWRVKTEGNENVTIFYRVFANELSVRTNHLDNTHGYFNGAALLFFVPGLEQQPTQVEIIPPQSDWQVTTTLPKVKGNTNTFLAPNFDTLVDSPFEIGKQQIYDFEVLGKSHQLAIWGKGNIDAHKVIEDTKKIIEVEANLYSGLPYENYLFLLHLSASGFGGLEHKESCSLNYSRFGFRAKDKYDRFMQLVAHEFFHLWNVKRIRPYALEKFDYEQENYTTSLWFCEGVTSYYDLLIPLWAGVYDRKTYLASLSKDITRFLTTPGRKVQPLSESSFDAWIKLYRRDANSDNSQISYYLKGEMVSLLLDLLIRTRHENRKSLNDVMVLMWEKFGKDEVGFTPEQLREVITSVADTDLTTFFDSYLDNTDELPFDKYLEPFGLQISGVNDKEPVPHLGIVLRESKGLATIKFVEIGSPASLAGLDTGDELLAIDGFKITAEKLSDRLKDYQPGDSINVSVFHGGELINYHVELAKSIPNRYQVKPIKSPTKEQRKLLAGWLGEELIGNN